MSGVSATTPDTTPDTPDTMSKSTLTPLPRWCSALIHNAERIAALPVKPAPASTLTRALHPLPAQQIAEHLALAGWRRELVWSRAPDGRRLRRVWWAPPGHAAPRQPRGRPRQYLTLAESLAALSMEP